MAERVTNTESLKIEGNNYYFDETTPKGSIWGKPAPETVQFISEFCGEGMVVGDFPAGDGRYAQVILNEGVDRYIAGDFDRKGLEKLYHLNISEEDKERVGRVVFDITNRWPFEDGSLDVAFTVGTLHLFGRKQVESIFKEASRVTKPDGFYVFNFASNVVRTNLKTNKPEIFNDEYPWKTEEVHKLVEGSFNVVKFDFNPPDPDPQIFLDANPPYSWNADRTMYVVRRKTSRLKTMLAMIYCQRNNF